MASNDSTSWKQVDAENPVSPALMNALDQVEHAQNLIADTLRRHGVTEERFARARYAAEQHDPEAGDVDVYLDELTRYVAALGGHLEVRAVFPDETITLRVGPSREPRAGKTEHDPLS